MDPAKAHPANLATRMALELDACTRCGTCSQNCSVLPVHAHIPNHRILPSEKLVAFGNLFRFRPHRQKELVSLQEGASICSACYRCTLLCPVGINLQLLWQALGETLKRKGYPGLYAWTREAMSARSRENQKDPIVPFTPEGRRFKKGLALSAQANTFSLCYQCQTCSNACPVVFSYPNPKEVLDWLPHQIMYSLKLGLKKEVLGARMIWDCLTCYLCQEHCPQGVQVTEIFYELKQMAYQELKAAS
jgi:heterodisulfide reductase subunit C